MAKVCKSIPAFRRRYGITRVPLIVACRILSTHRRLGLCRPLKLNDPRVGSPPLKMSCSPWCTSRFFSNVVFASKQLNANFDAAKRAKVWVAYSALVCMTPPRHSVLCW